MVHPGKRVLGLDVLRSIAVLCVLLAHTCTIVVLNKTTIAIAEYTAVIGVELFFVLSGFLIGTIIIKTHHQESVTSFKNIKIFWIRRWFRTLPNYYLMMLVYGGLYYLIHHQFFLDGGKFFLYFLFLQNAVTEASNEYFGVAWSLSIEEWFYLLFPLVLFAAQFLFRKKSSSLIVTILIFMIVPLAIRMVMANVNHISWDAGFRKIMVARLDSIGIGVLAAFIKYYASGFWESNKLKIAGLGLITIVPLLIVFYFKFSLVYNFNTAIETGDVGFFLKTAFFTLLSLSVACFLPALNAIKSTKINVIYAFFNFISLISYSLYLLHPIIITIVQHFLKGQSGLFRVSLIWAVSIAGAYIQFILFEKRMTSIREYFSGNKHITVA